MVIVMRKESYSMKCHADSSPASNDPENDKFFEDYLEVEYDKGFWSEVHEKQSKGLSWTSAMDEVRVRRLIQKYSDDGELDRADPALMMLKEWPSSQLYIDNPENLPGLEQLVNRFLKILLDSELNSDDRYESFRDKEDKAKRTLLHYAAELGFLQVTKTLVKKLPELLSLKTKAQLKPVEKRAMLPIELALVAEKDEVAAYLIRMMRHESVQKLFSWRSVDMTNPQPSSFSLKSIIENPKLKKTVIAVLDQMLSPHWPFLPERKDSYGNREEKEGIEGAWSTITDDPLNYHFYYHVLDGDKGGRPPKFVSLEGHHTDNEYFNWRDQSCLQVIAKSNNMEALQHPVVRMLIKRKWKSYGHLFLSLQAALYIVFLLLGSYSLLQASTKLDPTHYNSVADSVRGFCEVVILVMVVFYIGEEVNQLRIEKFSCFTDWMTLFDWLGLLLILCIIPLRYTGSKAQWLIASLAFLLNFLRIFKFSCVTSRFEDVVLSGFRALSEQKPIADDYSGFNWLSILVMLAYMGTVFVILLNILIAQMSTTYIQAKKVARLEYDMDRILQLTCMERFPFLSLRVKYYKEGDWISEKKLAEELLEFSEDRSPWESVEEKLNAIRDMMRKMVKQMRQERE